MDLAAAYMALPKEIRGGSICIYGDYFGRPLDSCVEPLAATYEEDLLTITFEGGLMVEVWEPQGVGVEGIVYTIERARRVRLTHTRPGPEGADVRYRDYTLVDGKLTIDSNDVGASRAGRQHHALTIC